MTDESLVTTPEEQAAVEAHFAYLQGLLRESALALSNEQYTLYNDTLKPALARGELQCSRPRLTSCESLEPLAT